MMAAPTKPDLSNVLLSFNPASYWYQGSYDASSLTASLKGQPGLADFPDGQGNMQSAVRLDHDADPSNVGFWVTVPTKTAKTVVDAGAAGAGAAAAAAQQQAAAAAWAQLRRQRDRWLAQTDYIEAFINSPSVMAHLPAAIQTAITANSAAWVAWRQALRDLPALKGLDPANPAWPAPPAQPVIHLT